MDEDGIYDAPRTPPRETIIPEQVEAGEQNYGQANNNNETSKTNGISSAAKPRVHFPPDVVTGIIPPGPPASDESSNKSFSGDYILRDWHEVEEGATLRRAAINMKKNWAIGSRNSSSDESRQREHDSALRQWSQSIGAEQQRSQYTPSSAAEYLEVNRNEEYWRSLDDAWGEPPASNNAHLAPPAAIPRRPQFHNPFLSSPRVPQQGSVPPPLPSSSRVGSAPPAASSSSRDSSAPHAVPSSSRDSSAPHAVPSSSQDGSAPHAVPSSSQDGSAAHAVPSSAQDGSAPHAIPSSSQDGSAPLAIPSSSQGTLSPSPCPTSPRNSDCPTPLPKITEHGGAPDPLPTDLPGPLSALLRNGYAVSVRDSNSRRGHGLFAIRDLPAKHVVLKEAPLLKVKKNFKIIRDKSVAEAWSRLSLVDKGRVKARYPVLQSLPEHKELSKAEKKKMGNFVADYAWRDLALTSNSYIFSYGCYMNEGCSKHVNCSVFVESASPNELHGQVTRRIPKDGELLCAYGRERSFRCPQCEPRNVAEKLRFGAEKRIRKWKKKWNGRANSEDPRDPGGQGDQGDQGDDNPTV